MLVKGLLRESCLLVLLLALLQKEVGASTEEAMHMALVVEAAETAGNQVG